MALTMLSDYAGEMNRLHGARDDKSYCPAARGSRWLNPKHF